MARQLSEERKKKVAEFLHNAPYQQRAELVKMFSDYGMLGFDYQEYMPISSSAEWGEFQKGIAEGASFGYYEGEPPDPRAGDIDVPYFGTINPSRTAGQAVGTAIPAIPMFMGGAAAATTIPGVKAGIAAGKFVPKAIRAIGAYGAGEFLPGGITGYIKSDGDWDKAAKMGAEFLAAGIIGETVFRTFIRAVKKMRGGKKLSSDEIGATEEVDKHIQKEIDNRKQADPYNTDIVDSVPEADLDPSDLDVSGPTGRLEQPDPRQAEIDALSREAAEPQSTITDAAQTTHRVTDIGTAVFASMKDRIKQAVDGFAAKSIDPARFLAVLGKSFDANIKKFASLGDESLDRLRENFSLFNRDMANKISQGKIHASEVYKEYEKFIGQLNNAYKDEGIVGSDFISSVRASAIGAARSGKEVVTEAGTTLNKVIKAFGDPNYAGSVIGRNLKKGEKVGEKLKEIVDLELGSLIGDKLGEGKKAIIASISDRIVKIIKSQLEDPTKAKAFAKGVEEGKSITAQPDKAKNLKAAKEAKEAKEAAEKVSEDLAEEADPSFRIVEDPRFPPKLPGREAKDAADASKLLDEISDDPDVPLSEKEEESLTKLISQALFGDSPDITPARATEAVSKLRKGDQGSFKLKDDSVPLDGKIISVEDDLVTIEIADRATPLILERSQIEDFIPPARGGAGFLKPDRPVSHEQLDEINKLNVEYRKWFDEDPKIAQPKDVTEARAYIRDTKAAIFNEKSRVADEGLPGGHEIREPSGDWKGVTAKGLTDEDLGQFYSKLPWVALKFVVPYSKWGLGSNPLTKSFVWKTLHENEKVGGKVAHYLDRYKQAIEPLGLSMMERVKATIPSQNASRIKLHEFNRKKILLARALDGDRTDMILSDHPELRTAYTQVRSILNDLADDLGLQKGERISYYFPHIFHGAVGKYMAGEISGELGKRGRWIVDQPDTGKLPTERLFQHMLERKGGEGFQLDLDAAIYTYIRGATRKKYLDSFLHEGKIVHSRLLGGMKQLKKGSTKQDRRKYRGQENTARYLEDWMRYIAGVPGESRIGVAKWWEDNQMFNYWVDKAVAYLGDAKSSEFLTKARMGRLNPDGTRAPYDQATEAEARNFFVKLVEDSNRYTREGDLKKNLPEMKRRRAELALKIEEIRNALGDPNAKPVVISSLYGLMVVNKLALNGSHAIINLTQTVANTIPSIGLTYSSRGVARYLSDKQQVYRATGKTTEEVLDDLKVLSDTPEAQEFMRPGIGTWNEIMDGFLMAPARITERFNRGVAGLGAYEKLIASGRSHGEAITEAREIVLKTQFPFNKAGVAPIMHQPIARLLLMFKSYPMHQINFSAELIQKAIQNNEWEPLIKHILAYATFAGVGAGFMSGTGFDRKTSHPAVDLANIPLSGNWGELGGPPASALIDVLHGQIGQALQEVTIPEWEQRVFRAAKQIDTPSRIPAELIGMAR
jgi:hypothetical protein